MSVPLRPTRNDDAPVPLAAALHANVVLFVSQYACVVHASESRDGRFAYFGAGGTRTGSSRKKMFDVPAASGVG